MEVLAPLLTWEIFLEAAALPTKPFTREAEMLEAARAEAMVIEGGGSKEDKEECLER
jgi:hypothetical protein